MELKPDMNITLQEVIDVVANLPCGVETYSGKILHNVLKLVANLPCGVETV